MISPCERSPGRRDVRSSKKVPPAGGTASFGHVHEFRDCPGSGSCQDLDAPAIGKFDGAKGHDLQAGIDPRAKPFRTRGSGGPVGQPPGPSRLYRSLASCCHRACLLSAIPAFAHGPAGRGLYSRLVLLSSGRRFFGLLLRLFLVCLRRLGRCIPSRLLWLRRARSRGGTGAAGRRSRGGTGGWRRRLGRRIDPWPWGLRLGCRYGGQQAKDQARIPDPKQPCFHGGLLCGGNACPVGLGSQSPVEAGNNLMRGRKIWPSLV